MHGLWHMWWCIISCMCLVARSPVLSTCSTRGICPQGNNCEECTSAGSIVTLFLPLSFYSRSPLRRQRAHLIMKSNLIIGSVMLKNLIQMSTRPSRLSSTSVYPQLELVPYVITVSVSSLER